LSVTRLTRREIPGGRLSGRGSEGGKVLGKEAGGGLCRQIYKMEKKIKKTTKQIRVSNDIHKCLKLKAYQNGKLLSNFADQIFIEYLENNSVENIGK